MSLDEAISTTQKSIAVLISGRGSNMQAIAKACNDGVLNARIDLVISNRADAPGLAAAQQLGLRTVVVDHTTYLNRHNFDTELTHQLEIVQPDWIVLAGFMRIFTDNFVNHWSGQILNIHPSLLPQYPGLNTHARAIAAGDTEAGASVHLVTPELDAGPVVAQVRVSILPDDTHQSLAERVLSQEHALYINALQYCLSHDLSLASKGNVP